MKCEVKAWNLGTLFFTYFWNFKTIRFYCEACNGSASYFRFVPFHPATETMGGSSSTRRVVVEETDGSGVVKVNKTHFDIFSA